MARKKIKKDKQLVIRLTEEEREQFIDLCYDLDTSASREVRKFIKKFIEKNGK